MSPRPSDALPPPEQVDQQATSGARAYAEVATRPPSGPWDDFRPQGTAQPAPGPWEDYGASAPGIPKSPAENLGVTNPIAAAPINFVAGVGSGALSSMFHGGDLIRRTFGMKRVINNPDVQSLIAAPDTLEGKVGRFGEQAAEFLAPGALAEKLTASAPLLARMAGQALAAGGTAAAQTGGDPMATATAAATGGAAPALGDTLGAVGRSSVPQRLYQSALKPTWSMVKNDGLKMIDTGLKEQIPVSATGLAEVEKRINDLRSEISKGIQIHAAQGKTVDTANVLKTLDGLEDFYRNTGAPKDALDKLSEIRAEFQQYHGQNIPIDKAQQIKINTYRLLKDSYGEMASAKVEGLKQVTRGLKEQISTVFPEVAALNERQSKLLGLDDAIYRAVWRIENHQMLGIGSPIAATAGHALLGGPGAAVAFAGKLLFDDPTLKSKLAIALSRAGVKNASGITSLRLAALKAMMENVAARSTSGSPGVPTPQPSLQPAQ